MPENYNQLVLAQLQSLSQAIEALRGDLTIQEIAARHKVHPDQVSTYELWRRRH